MRRLEGKPFAIEGKVRLGILTTECELADMSEMMFLGKQERVSLLCEERKRSKREKYDETMSQCQEERAYERHLF